MERTAFKVPKPCYGLEFDLSSSVCQECKFQAGCFEALGPRKTKVTLDKVSFKLVPKSFGLDNLVISDPELPAVERTYILCHQTIYGKRPRDRVGKHKNALIANVKAANCSVRLFMLTNMIAHKQQQVDIAIHTERAAKNFYSAVLFTHANSITRVKEYRDLCRKEFGTFDLSSLSTLTESDYSEQEITRKMYNSEQIAGKFIVGFKVRHGGPPWGHLYATQELALDPYWLATEPTYEETILKPHIAGERGSKALNGHRYAVSQIIAEMKRRKDWAIAVFQARERVMRQTGVQVLHHFGFREIDFEIENEPVTQATEYWVFLARAIQQVHCLRYIDGEQSIFRP